jgi:hypothetical protein
VAIDHGNAQATFVEISFGLNALFTAFPGWRGRLQDALKRGVETCTGVAQTIESKTETDRIGNISNRVSRMATSHLDAQDRVVPYAIGAALLAAISCVVIAFFDWFESCGHGLGWLILPFPVYCLFTASNYGIFRLRCWSLLREFKKLVDKFEKPAIPPEISGVPTEAPSD